MMLLAVVMASFALSALSAQLTHMFLMERIALIGSFLGLQKSYNAGVAFGFHLGSGQTFLVIFALLLVGFIAVRYTHSTVERVGFGLILGGGLANSLDRLLDGFVTDMIQVGRFPIFNSADICINVGIALILLAALRGKKERT